MLQERPTALRNSEIEVAAAIQAPRSDSNSRSTCRYRRAAAALQAPPAATHTSRRRGMKTAPAARAAAGDCAGLRLHATAGRGWSAAAARSAGFLAPPLAGQGCARGWGREERVRRMKAAPLLVAGWPVRRPTGLLLTRVCGSSAGGARDTCQVKASPIILETRLL